MRICYLIPPISTYPAIQPPSTPEPSLTSPKPPRTPPLLTSRNIHQNRCRRKLPFQLGLVAVLDGFIDQRLYANSEGKQWKVRGERLGEGEEVKIQ